MSTSGSMKLLTMYEWNSVSGKLTCQTGLNVGSTTRFGRKRSTHLPVNSHGLILYTCIVLFQFQAQIWYTKVVLMFLVSFKTWTALKNKQSRCFLNKLFCCQFEIVQNLPILTSNNCDTTSLNFNLFEICGGEKTNLLVTRSSGPSLRTGVGTGLVALRDPEGVPRACVSPFADPQKYFPIYIKYTL